MRENFRFLNNKTYIPQNYVYTPSRIANMLYFKNIPKDSLTISGIKKPAVNTSKGMLGALSFKGADIFKKVFGRKPPQSEQNIEDFYTLKRNEPQKVVLNSGTYLPRTELIPVNSSTILSLSGAVEVKFSDSDIQSKFAMLKPRESFIIGRDADIVRGANNNLVSRKHLQVFKDDNSNMLVKDISTNGTSIITPIVYYKAPGTDYKTSASSGDTMMKVFFDGKSSDNLLSITNFEQYGKNGLPLTYKREDFLSDLSRRISYIDNPKTIYKDLGIEPVFSREGKLIGYNGLLNPSRLPDYGSTGKVKATVEQFLYENAVETGNSELDQKLNALIKGFPELINIIGKQQHKRHSFSLDVHTMKVLQEAIKNPQYKTLSPEDKLCLKIAVVFHDIAKSELSIDENHAANGAMYARHVLNNCSIELSDELKARICNQIENHEWLKYYNTGKLSSNEFLRRFPSKNDQDIAFIISEADLKGVEADNAYYKKYGNDLNKAIAEIRQQSQQPSNVNVDVQKQVKEKLKQLSQNPEINVYKNQRIDFGKKEVKADIYTGIENGLRVTYIKPDSGGLYFVKNFENPRVYQQQIANELYELAGVDVSEKKIVKMGSNAPLGIATEYIGNVTPNSNNYSSVLHGFAADCWLANWDALKVGNVIMKNGTATRTNMAGSLMYRALGERKFQNFGENVDELVTFFNPNSRAYQYVQNMSRDELLTSLKTVTNIKDEQIRNIVYKYTGTKALKSQRGYNQNAIGIVYDSDGIQNPEYLSQMLIERRNYIKRFETVAKNTPMYDRETISHYVNRISGLTQRTVYTDGHGKQITFYEDGMIPSERAIGTPGLSIDEVKKLRLGEYLTPDQKRLLTESKQAFDVQQENKIQYAAINHGPILTKDNMLHCTDGAYLERILNEGLKSREYTGISTARYTDGRNPGSLTPMCVDVWDVDNTYRIDKYFSKDPKYGRIWNDGEEGFLPKPSDSTSIAFVFNRNALNQTIIKNSFKVTDNNKLSARIMHQDGNMSGYSTYTSHRVIPVGIPASAIEKIIVPNGTSWQTIDNYKRIIQKCGYNISIYNMNGTQL